MKRKLLFSFARIIGVVSSAMLLSLSLHSQPLTGFQAYTYRQTDTVSLKLYVKNPEGLDNKRSYPVIVFFFGGGWSSGKVSQFEPHANYFSSRGMITVLADYRVKSRHQSSPFDAVSDAKSVIRYLRSNAGILHIDTSKIVTSGGSAGGHIAAAAATVPGLNDPADNLKFSARPNALVLFNPVFDNGPQGFGYERIGERYKEISPIHNIQIGTPPTIVFLGTKDDLIPIETAKLYKKTMEEKGCRCDLFLFDGQKHGFFNYREDNSDGNRYFTETVYETDIFLESLGYIKGKPTISQGRAQYQGTRIVTERKYTGCIELSNDSFRVVLEPNLGGRVLAYELNGKNVLYVDDKQDGLIYEGKNLHPSGGRSDFGPERVVPAHPGLYLGRWNARITGDREAEMISQKDTGTGVQLIRKFRLAKSGSRLEFTQVIKNISTSDKSYCHWSRTFVKGGGISLAPLNPQSRYPAGYLIYGPGKILNYMPENETNIRIREGILEITGPPSQPKIVTDSYAGWLAYITKDNQLFIKKYPVFPHKNYGEIAASTACVFYKPLYCEIEPIGPMETIAPGKEAAFTETWYLYDYTYPVDNRTDLQGLLLKMGGPSFEAITDR